MIGGTHRADAIDEVILSGGLVLPGKERSEAHPLGTAGRVNGGKGIICGEGLCSDIEQCSLLKAASPLELIRFRTFSLRQRVQNVSVTDSSYSAGATTNGSGSYLTSFENTIWSFALTSKNACIVV